MEVMGRGGRSGLRVKQIVRLVCNESQSFFEPVSYGEVYLQVTRYLKREAARHDSPIEHAARWGYYRLRRTQQPADELRPVESDGNQPMLPFEE